MLRTLGHGAKATRHEIAVAEFIARINRWCWNEHDNFSDDMLADSRQFPKKTVCGFWPLLAGIVPPERVKRLVALLRNECEFSRPFIFPALAADKREYKAPSGHSWRGAI